MDKRDGNEEGEVVLARQTLRPNAVSRNESRGRAQVDNAKPSRFWGWGAQESLHVSTLTRSSKLVSDVEKLRRKGLPHTDFSSHRRRF